MTPHEASAGAALSVCRVLGIEVRPVGDRLAVRAPAGVMTDSIRDMLKRRKPEIIRALGCHPSPPCPSALAERIAIMVESDMPEPEAEVAALREAGFASWTELAEAHRRQIKWQLDAIALRSDIARRLDKISRAFIASPWFEAAMRHGWSEIELFGFAGKSSGLVVGLVLAGDGCELVGIDNSGARIQLRDGQRCRVPIWHPRLDTASPWWSATWSLEATA